MPAGRPRPEAPPGVAVLGDEGSEGLDVAAVVPATPSALPLPVPRRITMDLFFDADGRPGGSVWVGASAPQQVLGWLELMSELSRLLSEEPDDGGGE